MNDALNRLFVDPKGVVLLCLLSSSLLPQHSRIGRAAKTFKSDQESRQRSFSSRLPETLYLVQGRAMRQREGTRPQTGSGRRRHPRRHRRGRHGARFAEHCLYRGGRRHFRLSLVGGAGLRQSLFRF